MVPICSALLFGIFLSISGFIAADEMIYDQIELLNSTYNANLYNISEFRVTKFNRTSFVIKASFEFFVDLDDSYEMQIVLYHNRLNNNQYTKQLAQIPKEKFCTVMKRYHRTKFTEMNRETNNFPTEDQGYCPLKKGVYWLNNYAFDNDKIPPVLKEGHWKAEMYLYRNKEVVLGMRAYFKIIKQILGFGR